MYTKWNNFLPKTAFNLDYLDIDIINGETHFLKKLYRYQKIKL